VRAELAEPFRAKLGPLAQRLEPFS
jgi:hypothetical protein